ncbi:MAG TPA: RHS repeat-associated core domain-containing protein [Actinocatenispora sp.]
MATSDSTIPHYVTQTNYANFGELETVTYHGTALTYVSQSRAHDDATRRLTETKTTIPPTKKSTTSQPRTRPPALATTATRTKPSPSARTAAHTPGSSTTPTAPHRSASKTPSPTTPPGAAKTRSATLAAQPPKPGPTTRGYLNGQQDLTALTHLGAREYDPANGRFISDDPISSVRSPQQINGYAYALNNPTTYQLRLQRPTAFAAQAASREHSAD